MRVLSLIVGVIGCLSGSVSYNVAAENEIPGGAVLTNAAQVRSLPATETGARLPVRLSGVVIDTATVAPDRFAIILADRTAGIYVLSPASGQNVLSNFNRGDVLEVKGVTGAGLFAPIVQAQTAQKVGTAPLPAAEPSTYQQLITGALDAQWVEIQGVVRQVFEPVNSDVGRIIIATDGGLVPVRCVMKPGSVIQVDSEVCVHAVCYYQFNQKRQVLSPVLQVPRGMPVQVEKPAPANPYEAPLRSAASLLVFSPDNLNVFTHRVHVRGVVTSSQPGSFIWIRDGSSGLRIQTQQPGDLQPGDQIEVLGFPILGSYTPTLEDAAFRKIGSGASPAPIVLTNFVQAFDHEDDLVVAEGMLSQVQPVLDGMAFTLDRDERQFRAVLKMYADPHAHPNWQAGCRVRVTGICSLTHDDGRPYAGIWQPKSFQILLRSPADLAVLVPAPWWTPRHITMVLSIVIGALALMIGIVTAVSRRRLHEQERQREMAEAEFSAILSERNRVGREIHDTLAQGLTATSVQLQLAKKKLNGTSEVVNQHLDSALSLVRESLKEARNSIWNMRAQILEKGNLSDALQAILAQMADGTETVTGFDLYGRARRLAPVIENNILRIGQEAIVNATKHSGAKHVKVVMDFEEKQFQLRVADDGRGFDPAAPRNGDGGFGLVGMRERAAEMNGELTLRSAPGQGTEIILSIPLSAE